MSTANSVTSYLKQVTLPAPDSHKGQNGKLLIIGGSELFHAASKWSLDIASKFVDMVFYASIPSNNDLIKQAKAEFWNGIVIERSELENYLGEADCILIGPGMERSPETQKLTNQLLKKYPTKKWVIDAGALQMVDPSLLNQNCIITPHEQELARVLEKLGEVDEMLNKETCLNDLSQKLNGVCILYKGKIDYVAQGEMTIEIEGGNAGMTKGGTGDVLAGVVAGLYACNEMLVAAVAGSYVNKAAGDSLYQKVGPFYNASDLVTEIPKVLWQAIKK